MKKLIYLTIVLWVATGVVSAQNNTGKYTPGERAGIQTSWMKENLKLTPEQVPVIEKLNIEYAQKMEEVKSVNGKMEQLKKAKSITSEKDEKLQTILSKEQFEIYAEKRSELRKNLKENSSDSRN